MDDLVMDIKKSLKNLFFYIYKCLFNATYKVLCLIRKTNENRAVFVLSRSKELEGNLSYVYKELIKQEPAIEIHFVHTENKMNLKLFTEILKFSNASYLILDDYYLPVYLVKPSKDLKIIQLWHAAGAFKKFGYSTKDTKFGPSTSYLNMIPIHSNYSHVYVSSAHVIPYYAEAFNMSAERIFPIGPPRIDLFNNQLEMSKKKNIIKETFPEISNNKKTLILIAPTYRASGSHQESDLNIIDNLIQHSQKLRDDIQVIFKGHPYIERQELLKLNKCPNITIASKFTINDWMLITDALVTDYSSSVFDFSLLKKPMAHFVPDLDQYVKNRGLYEGIQTLSDGEIITNVESLIKWINERQKDEYYNTSRMIEYNFDNTIDVSSKIVSHFKEI